MPDNKTKEENFIRLAEARTNKIIGMIDLLGNLSNKTNYSYTNEQIEHIFQSIEDALKESKELFYEEPVPKRKKFRL
ncbi:MAG: hypothetical protein SO189_07565 [Erysipelotrichaceae bacterium]|nr:hypothetical protein [Solobacterium sp.]MDY2638904.1 hypothetical protein [Ligilactobacillus salivarius]MDY3794794.1 hypothetical protein [Erysipelotrichaceae bacterium]